MTVSVMAEAAIWNSVNHGEDLIVKMTYRSNGSRPDAVFCALASKGLRKSNETHLGGTVIGLAEVTCENIRFEMSKELESHTVEAGGTSSVDNATELLLAEEGPGSLRACKRTLQMDLHDLVPFLVGHVLEASVDIQHLVPVVALEAYPLSLRIPALLIRIVTVPKASTADLITAAPSATDEVLVTALPPAETV